MIAAMIRPSTLPPIRRSLSAAGPAPAAPAPAPAVCTRAPLGQDRVRSPMANRAGSPAPASRPYTTIFHSALRLIQDIVCLPVPQACSSGRRGGLGFRSNRSGPVVVDVLVVHLGGPGLDVDDHHDREQDEQVDYHAEGTADHVVIDLLILLAVVVVVYIK